MCDLSLVCKNGEEPTIMEKKSKNFGINGHKAPNVLKNDNSSWIAGLQGERCEFVIDLGCVKKIRGVKLRNSYGNENE